MWRVIHDRQLQATHCPEEPSWTGRWFAPSSDRGWRVWACPDHLDGLAGLKPVGGSENMLLPLPRVVTHRVSAGETWKRANAPIAIIDARAERTVRT